MSLARKRLVAGMDTSLASGEAAVVGAHLPSLSGDRLSPAPVATRHQDMPVITRIGVARSPAPVLAGEIPNPTTTACLVPPTSCAAPAAQEPLTSASGHAVQGDPASGPIVPCETTPAAEQFTEHAIASAQRFSNTGLYDRVTTQNAATTPVDALAESRSASDGGGALRTNAGRDDGQLTGHDRLLALVDEAITAWRKTLDPQRTGRPSRWVWEDHREWIAAVVERLNRTNRGDGLLSMTEAVWSSLSHPLVPDGFESSLRAMQTRYSFSPALRAILGYISVRIAPWSRDPHRAILERGVHGSGFLRRHWSEPRRLHAGEALCFDDGSINLVCWVDWPWGGDKVSNKWGCIVGRFQFLLCEDVASGFFPGYSFVARPLGSYRAEDALGTIARMAHYQVRAERHVLERATWESKAVEQFHEATGIEAVHTYTPRHKTVEPGFGRLWGRMAPDERLSLGRFRGQDKEGTNLWRKLRTGSVDPREHCQSLAEVVALLDRAIGRANTEPISSKVYGNWVPAERWAQDLKAFPRGRLADDLWWAWAPERHEKQVRKAGVTCSVNLYGGNWAYTFSWPSAELYEGKTVKVCFDPLADPCRAAVVLLENSPYTFEAAGTVLTHDARLLSDVPTFDGAALVLSSDAAENVARMKAIHRSARQWVFRAFAPDGRTVHTAEAETRGPSREIVAATRVERAEAHAPAPRPARIQTEQEEEESLAYTLAAERSAQQLGLMPAEYPQY